MSEILAEASTDLPPSFYESAVRQNLKDVAWKADKILEFLREIDLQPGTIVELGGGTGRLVSRVARGHRALSLSVDLSRFSLTTGARDHGHPHLCQGDATVSPVRDGAFDLCLLIDIIEHVRKPQAVLSEGKRVARDVLLKVPLEDNLWRRLLDGVGLFTRGDSRRIAGHLYWWKAVDVWRLLLPYSIIAEQSICPDADRPADTTLLAKIVSRLRALSLRILPRSLFMKIWGGDLLVLYRGNAKATDGTRGGHAHEAEVPSIPRVQRDPRTV